MSSASLVAVVVNHRCSMQTATCVASLHADAPDCRVLVVDNSEDPQEMAALNASVGSLAHIVATANAGFGAACNVGFERAFATWSRIEHVLLVNPDTLVTRGAVAALLACARRHPDHGIVGARLLSMDDDRVLFERGVIRRWTLTGCHVRAGTDLREVRSEFVTGACMLIHADLLRNGLRFDAGYFLYVEDMDLCCAVAARGRSLWVALDATVKHRDGGTQINQPKVLGEMRANQLYWLTRGKVRFARKWLRWYERWSFLAVSFLVKPLAGIVLARGVGFLRPYLTGLRDGLRDRRGVPSRKRKLSLRRDFDRRETVGTGVLRDPRDTET